jgi:ABC-2 type transport system permease protein
VSAHTPAGAPAPVQTHTQARVPAPGDGRAAPRARIVASLVRQELRIALRRGESLLITFAIPVGILLLAGLAVGGGGGNAPVANTLLPGTIALAVVGAALVALGIATAYERLYGVLKRLGGSPAGRGSVVTAKTMAIVIVETVQLVLLVGAAWIVLEWRPGPGASPLIVVLALVLGTTAFAGGGLLLAATIRAEATIAVTNLLFLVFLALGGIIVPLDRLPDPVATVAAVLPAAPLAEALGIGFGTEQGDPLGPLSLLAGWAILLGGLAARRFRWD